MSDDPAFLAGLGCEVTAFDVSPTAIEAFPGLVAPGGTLLVIARATDEEDPVRHPAIMPWPVIIGVQPR